MRSHVAAILVLSISTLPVAAQQGATSRGSVDSSGAQGNAQCIAPAISADGRVIAFTSDANNLGPGDTNLVADIFVHDTQTGVTTRVSVDSLGIQGDLYSLGCAFSADGRYVAMTSMATNLVTGDTNGMLDVFLRDRTGGTTERVSVSSLGVQGDFASADASISADGRYVAFDSFATNLVSGDTNACTDVFVRDRALGNTYRVSVDFAGAQGSGDSLHPAVSADGRFVAFESDSTLVPSDINGKRDIYVFDAQSGIPTLASVSTSGAVGNDYSAHPSISGDGRFVVFESDASSLVVGDSNNELDVFVRDLTLGVTSRVSVSSLGAQGLGQSRTPSISMDGRCVTFQSDAANLVGGDTNGVNGVDTFIHDRYTHTTMRTSVDSAGVQTTNAYNQASVVSGDGRRVLFISNSANLVPNDTNGTEDVFLREIYCGPPATYCEAGLSTNFCSPTMSASGTASASSTSGFALTCTGLEAQKTGLILYGTSGRIAHPWGPIGGSILCVAHPVQRMTSQDSGGTLNYCNGAITIDWLAFVATHPNALGYPLTAGALIDAQCWYRDPPAPKGTNLSNAIEFELCP